jgi:DMSO/TMAO reductase YedYZ molybdopterin-dependent catalytic subunit
METRQDLPKYSIQDFDLKTWRLKICGLFHSPRDLKYDDLLELPGVSLTDDFTCLEGWKVEGVAWEGVKLSEVLSILGALPETRFLRLASGNYSLVLPLERAKQPTTLLALRKDGAPLDAFHGGPVRLVLHGQECYESVKGLDKIEALAESEESTAADIALGRISNR